MAALSQRCVSPAQVTSSSSPLSNQISTCSSMISSQNIGAAHQSPMIGSQTSQPGEARLHDTKLKENIEYLTALLCNGNKLDDAKELSALQIQQQQSNISSTMARSYATLAHSLSTGPKLLDRQNSFGKGIQQTVLMSGQQAVVGMNEASPSCAGSTSAGSCGVKRQYPAQWACKAGVESSVSAADSTDCQISSLSLQDQARKGARSSELKILSSLLNSNKGTTTNGNVVTASQPVQSCVQVHQNVWQAPVSQAEPTRQETTVSVPAPPNGKPITLTPVVSHNGLIVQQQQQQEKRSRATLFAQPASPSASSSASSTMSLGAMGDIGASLTQQTILAPPTTKKQRQSLAGQQLAATKAVATSNRLARPNSLSTECSMSSHDEGFSSQVDHEDGGSTRDSDDEDDVDSDDESFYGDYTNSDLIGASISDNAENKWTLNMGRTRRNGQKRYFWQYNVQSKGPKGARISSTDSLEDPFVLPEASDPVFSNDCQVEGVKHSGKARRGDGNDLTPNPKKLLMIGLELKKLGKIINELAPVTELPINARNKTRKEKNKLASRACRLKKKAQHEANKIKLYGLQREHQQVVLAIYDVRKLLSAALLENETQLSGCSNLADQQVEKGNSTTLTANEISLSGGTSLNLSARSIAEQCSMRVAGQTSDYVNSVLEKVVSGCIDGGLQI